MAQRSKSDAAATPPVERPVDPAGRVGEHPGIGLAHAVLVNSSGENDTIDLVSTG